jgi:hypothetical protein
MGLLPCAEYRLLHPDQYRIITDRTDTLSLWRYSATHSYIGNVVSDF